ncbi:hypothetical protein AHAS_Ahas16G0120700 [Arachis hypogaea]
MALMRMLLTRRINGTWMLKRRILVKEEFDEWCKPWHNALIVKVLGKRMGLGFIEQRLRRDWAEKGSAIGQMLKIDHTTSIHSRGRFARICVEIDLAKKTCTAYGHRMDQCSETVVEQAETQKVENADQKADSGDNQEIEDNQNESSTDCGI